MLEDDHYRYLWDGAVIWEGVSPYAFAPGEVGPDHVLAPLAGESGLLAARINHPDLRTIYPPVAQAFFALSHWLAPFNLEAFRLVLLLAESATFVLLLALLHALSRSPLWIALYWWNPLIIKEFANSAHMDALLLPFLLGTLLLVIRRRFTWAALCLALAAGVKLWPALLLPVVLRGALNSPGRAVLVMLVFSLPIGLMAIPILSEGLDARSGFVAFTKLWEANDALFMALAWATGDAARPITAIALIALTLWLHRNDTAEPEMICRRVLIIVAALFLLSPALFPWYFSWVAVLLPLVPVTGLLVLSALLPLYYLRFMFAARGDTAFFDTTIVWFEYGPALILIALGVWRERRMAR